jgi:hypothetical protein
LAVATLQARRAAHQRPPAAADLVLPTLTRDGKSIAPISGWNWLKRQLDRVSGVPEWRLHDFRRSIVSICAERGANIAVLDTLLNPCEQRHPRRRHWHLSAGAADRANA